MGLLNNGGNANGHDDGHDPYHNHDLDESESGTAGRAPPAVAPRALPAGNRRPMPAQSHRVLMLDVMVNIVCKTLKSRKPTITAIMMIMAGSIRFVITRKAIVNSFS
jgi:hypothetical protein